MELPEDLLYTEQHEWAQVEGKIVTIGITDFAQSQLGDIVFIDLPEEDSEIAAEDTFGVIESVKAVSDLYSPLTGKIIEVNTSLLDSPNIVNDDPYGEGWLIKVEISSASSKEIKDLLDASKYQDLVEGQESDDDLQNEIIDTTDDTD